MENKIISSFHQLNQGEQQLQFLNAKYAFLIKNFHDKDKENMTEQDNILIQKIQDIVPSGQDFTWNDLRIQGLMDFLSELDEKQKKLFLKELITESNKDTSETEEMIILMHAILQDHISYQQTKKEIEKQNKETIDGHTKGQLSAYISQSIQGDLKTALLDKNKSLQGEQDTIKANINTDTREWENDDNTIKEDIGELLKKEVIDPIVYFHLIQTVFRKYNYVLTFQDIGRLKKIMKRLEQGKMVFLSGDTGSGKTELCIFIAQLRLEARGQTNNTPIIIGGNKETDLSDFTIEKVVNSENLMSTSQDDLIRGERNNNDNIQNILQTLIDKDSLKKDILGGLSEKLQKDTEERKKIQQQVEDLDFEKYNIFTKYHAKGLIKAMHDGKPLIIDEMNAIRPAVLIGLNHYLTRKIGQTISLPNGLGSFTIKDGFCIMCTGNDKEANSQKDMYESRYKIDESLINRMTIIQKGYMNQINTEYSNSNNLGIDQDTTTIEYLQENELYTTLLLLFFEKDKKKKEITQRLTSNSKIGFDLMKEEFVGKTEQERKTSFFRDLKKFAVFIKLIQDAFEKKGTIMCDGKDISNLISKRVLSMRNIRNIIQDYRSDSKSLFYHIYENYLSESNGNEDEQKGILYALKEAGLFPFSVAGTLNLNNGTKEIQDRLQKQILKEKNGGDTEGLISIHDKKTPINKEILAHRLVITKQDIYQEFFGNKLDNINDAYFQSSDITENIKKHTTEETESITHAEKISIHEIKEQASTLQEILNDNTYLQNNFIKNIPFQGVIIIQEVCNVVSQDNNKLSQENIQALYKTFNTFLANIANNQVFSAEDNNNITMMKEIISPTG